MWDWAIGPSEVAWVAWALWMAWHRLQRSKASDDIAIGLTDPEEASPTSRSANLLNAEGVLESVRTIHGDPPEVITTRRTQYHLDLTATGRHLTYRAGPPRG